MTRLKKGLLVAVEGIDGSGKSSLVQNLYDLSKPELANVLLTKEPGGSQLGKHLRTILQEQTVPITAKAEFLLFAADRAQHFAEVIMPALAQNTLIISEGQLTQIQEMLNKIVIKQFDFCLGSLGFFEKTWAA